jgi:tRNA(fMet)-specific endonuclease VapC
VIYFLYKNIVVFCLRGQSAPAMRRIHATAATDIRLPLQVHAELLVGVAKSAHPERTRARVAAFLAPFAIVWPDEQVEEHYVDIRTLLERRGTPISEADLWIAATARAANGTIVTNNVQELSRVPNLQLDRGAAVMVVLLY